VNPPFFPAVNVAAVQAVLGSNPLRVYPFGEAPQGEPRPYAVWQTIAGTPEAYLGDVPDNDAWLVQVDVYAESESPETGIRAVTEAARVLREALETVAYITSLRPFPREGTRLYRYSFDVSFQTAR
jgi:hypothetical protein